ncbi:MAG: endonuclease/exonuclease/phosphatase family protein [Cyanobacteria bacterium J083]|nr:MAG: endonuclease/exonuclease/phosphatase family protein [Cyanobacteria bacterium J083]
MFEPSEQQSSLIAYFKQLSPTHRFGKISATTIEQTHPSPVNLERSSIKILSWNIAKNNQNARWKADFLAILQQHQPDKIFLQEVRLCAIAQQIPELASMGWSFAPNLIDNWDNTYSGVLIATKSDRLNSQAKITQHQEPITKTPKVSLFVEYSWGNKQDTLLAVNTHLINFVETTKFQAQLQEIEAVISQHRGAVILAGDFNTWNLSRWLLLLNMARRLNLTPVSFPLMEAIKIKRFLLSPPLDYIFYRGLKQKSANAQVLSQIKSSDHNPLLVELDL